MNSEKDCSYRAFKNGECRYDEYLEQAYNAKGKVTTHTTSKVKKPHPFYIIEKFGPDYGRGPFTIFAIHDEARGLLLEIELPPSDTNVNHDELWVKVSKSVFSLREYFRFINESGR